MSYQHGSLQHGIGKPCGGEERFRKQIRKFNVWILLREGKGKRETGEREGERKGERQRFACFFRRAAGEE